MSTFIETTLPPGYRGNAHCNGTAWSWYTVDTTIYRYADTEAERNRSAWRHWTATVLRGRDVEWGDNECEGRWVMAGCDSLDPYAYAARGGEIGIVNVDRKCVVASGDIDEAMARFAAIVLATEGIVPR